MMFTRMQMIGLCLALTLLTPLWFCHATVQVQQTQADRLQLGDPASTGVEQCIANGYQAESFVETVYIDSAALPPVTPKQKKRGYVVFQRHWMDLVFPVSVPRAEEITDKLSLIASPGEYEPASFCIRTLKEIRGLQVSATDLVSRGGNRIAAPELVLVRCVPRAWQGEEWLYEDGPVGVMNMPAYLEKLRLLDIAAGRTVQFWVTVKVEQDAEPGMYQGEIEITDEQGGVQSLAVELEVQPVILAEPPQTLGWWDFQRPYNDEIGTIDEVYRVMAEHGAKAVHCRAGLFTYDKKRDHYDFSKFIAVDEAGKVTVTLAGSPLGLRMEASKKVGFRYHIYSSHLFLFVDQEIKARYDAKFLAEQSAREIARVIKRFEDEKVYEIIKKEITDCSKNHPAIYSEVYGDLFVAVIRAVNKAAKERGYPPLVFPSWDEAFSNHHRNKDVYPFVLRHLELIKRGGGKTEMNHCSPFSGGEYGAYVRAAMEFLDIAMPAPRLSDKPHVTSGYHATLEMLVEAYGKKDIDTYNYSLSGQEGGVHPGLTITRFCAGFFFHSRKGSGIKGNFDYIFYRIEEDPYNPITGHNWSHERIWFFPPQPQTTRLGGPSITLTAKREGYDDLRYLHTLSKLIEQGQATSDMLKRARATRRAAAVRDKILGSLKFSDEILDVNVRGLKGDWDQLVAGAGKQSTISGSRRLGIGWNYEDYDNNRRAIAEQIIKLQKVLN